MNLKDLSNLELAKLHHNVKVEIKARRPRAEKRKVRRKSGAQRLREQSREAWEAFKEQHCDGGYCWACGRTEADKPDWWTPASSWFIHRMHFVHSGMGRVVKDPRLVIAACSGCHGHYHQTIAQWTLPRLTDANCAWLKREHGDYDPVFIANNNTGGAIMPVKPPQEFFLARERFVHLGGQA